MKKFTIPTRDQVTPANQAIFDSLKNALGSVPNLYAVMAHSDNGLHKFLAYQNAKTSLSAREKEAVNLVVSEINGCEYCLSAHTWIGKLHGFNELEILDLRNGFHSDSRLNALVRLAKDIVKNKGRAAAGLSDFYAAGYNDGNLVDLMLQISDKVAMNYLHNLTQVEIDFPIASKLTHAIM